MRELRAILGRGGLPSGWDRKEGSRATPLNPAAMPAGPPQHARSTWFVGLATGVVLDGRPGLLPSRALAHVHGIIGVVPRLKLALGEARHSDPAQSLSDKEQSAHSARARAEWWVSTEAFFVSACVRCTVSPVTLIGIVAGVVSGFLSFFGFVVSVGLVR